MMGWTRIVRGVRRVKAGRDAEPFHVFRSVRICELPETLGSDQGIPSIEDGYGGGSIRSRGEGRFLQVVLRGAPDDLADGELG
jgi:hypothetical protein